MITRFEVIDHTTDDGRNATATADGRGRVFSLYSERPLGVEVVYQDDGRTVKVFLTDTENNVVAPYVRLEPRPVNFG